MKLRIAALFLIGFTLSCNKDDSPHIIRKALAFFVAKNDSTANLWYVRTDGLWFTQVLDDNMGLASGNPTWSADGRRIYFIRQTRSAGVNGVYCVKSDGSDYRPVMKDSFPQLRNFYQLAASRADEHLMFSLDLNRNGRKVVELYRMSISGSSVERITNFESSQGSTINTESYAGSFSPGDSLLVFSQGDPSLNGRKDVHIYTYNFNTDSIRKIRTFKAANVLASVPSYSPDGTRFLLSIDGLIHTMNVDGSDLNALGTLKGYHPCWDPNGKEFSFSSFGVPGMRQGIYRADINLTSVKIISRSSKYGQYGGLSYNKIP